MLSPSLLSTRRHGPDLLLQIDFGPLLTQHLTRSSGCENAKQTADGVTRGATSVAVRTPQALLHVRVWRIPAVRLFRLKGRLSTHKSRRSCSGRGPLLETGAGLRNGRDGRETEVTGRFCYLVRHIFH
jgi:hypothetical protein